MKVQQGQGLIYRTICLHWLMHLMHAVYSWEWHTNTYTITTTSTHNHSFICKIVNCKWNIRYNPLICWRFYVKYIIFVPRRYENQQVFVLFIFQSNFSPLLILNTNLYPITEPWKFKYYIQFGKWRTYYSTRYLSL